MIKAEYDYYIAQDSFDLYFPEGDYDVELLYDWYNIIPTTPKIISYYGDNIELLKRQFEKFSSNGLVKTRKNNDLHAEEMLNIHVLCIYDKENNLQGFAAQQWENGAVSKIDIIYNI